MQKLIAALACAACGAAFAGEAAARAPRRCPTVRPTSVPGADVRILGGTVTCVAADAAVLAYLEGRAPRGWNCRRGKGTTVARCARGAALVVATRPRGLTG